MTASDDPAPKDSADPGAAAELDWGARLSEGQRTALQNLARKEAGQDVDWINIGDARSLTELGLAVRNQEGWRITPAGLSALRDAEEGPAS